MRPWVIGAIILGGGLASYLIYKYMGNAFQIDAKLRQAYWYLADVERAESLADAKAKARSAQAKLDECIYP